MMFVERQGGPVAAAPIDSEGRTRRPDGRHVFTIAQAARRFGWTEQALAELYELTFDPANISGALLVLAYRINAGYLRCSVA